MININHVFFDGEKELEDSSLSFKGKKTPLTKLAIDIIKKVQELDDFKNPQFKGDKIYENSPYVIDFPTNEDINIDVVFVNKNEELLDYWCAPENVVGLHCLNSGAFESSDGDFISTKHRVLVTLEEEALKKILIDNKNEYTEEFLTKVYINTITHELGHCLEWIQNTNGLTPNEVQNLIEDDYIDVSFNEIITGDGILFKKNKYETKNDLEDAMEKRVEEMGMSWLNQIDIDKDLLKKAIRSCKRKNIFKLR